MYFQSRLGTVTPGARVTHAKAPSCFNFKLAQLLDFIVEAGFISTTIDIDSHRITDSINTPAEYQGKEASASRENYWEQAILTYMKT